MDTSGWTDWVLLCGALYPFSPLFRPASVKGDLYVVVAALWLVVSPHSLGDDACLRCDVRFCVQIPQRALCGMLRQ